MTRRLIIGWLLILVTGPLLARAQEQADVEKRLKETFTFIRDFDWWTDNDPWARAIFTMIDSGRDGLPTLLAELRDTDFTRLQRTIPIAVGEIGDRRAIPYLIYALARCRPDTGNNGFNIPDGELYWRMRRLVNPPVDDPYGTVSDERPEQVMSDALTKLTGHTEPWQLQSNYGEDGAWPKIWDDATHEQKRQVQRRLADRWWAWFESNKNDLLTPDELGWVNRYAPRSYQSPPKDSPRSITLTAQDETGAAAKDYTVAVWADREHYTDAPDAEGRITFKLPEKADRVTVVASRAGSVPIIRFWPKGSPVPESYQIQFPRAVQTSGTIVDQSDQPVAGATVWLVGMKRLGENLWADVAFRDVVTDAEGRWSTAVLPDSARKLKVFVQHARHQLYEQSHDAATLAGGKLKIALKPVFDLTGTVVGADGKPVSGASVRALGEPAYKHDYRPVKTDAAGKFLIPGVWPTKLSLAVSAEGFAPQQQKLEVRFDKPPEPMQLRLEPGRTLRGRITDDSGAPIARAIVSLGNFGGNRLTDWFTRADADGRFQWDHAPNEEIALEVFRTGRITATLAAKPGEDVLLKLKPMFGVSGTVTDARTKQPIRQFTYVQGVLGNNGKKRFLWRNYQKHFSDERGHYERVFPASHSPRQRQEDTQQFYLRIEADGFMPQETRIFDENEGPLTFDFALEPAEPITGTVVSADGKPVPDAVVLLATPTQEADVYNGRKPDRKPEECIYVKTDAQGRFVHRPQNESFELVVLHDSGFARADAKQLAASKGQLKLAAWGRVEGTVTLDGKPVAEADLTLSDPTYHDENRDPALPLVQTFASKDADKQGRFVFERLLPGRYRLSAQSERRGAMSISGPGFPFEVQSGQTLRLDFGGEARRDIIGRLTTPKAGAIDWSGVKLVLAPRGKDEDRRSTTGPATKPAGTPVPVKADGTFRIEGVQGGIWMLTLDDMKLPPEPTDPSKRERTARGGTSFELPAGQSETPLDLGPINVSISRSELKPGMSAPPIEAQTLDGKPLKLSDFAGKYVLLDFWATWCGPCVAETPHLKAVHDALGKDSRFVMIGLSMDSAPGRALAYTRANQMDWVQGFIGMWGQHPAAADYGVDGIPSILLIGPDGKVIATNLRGESIKPAVESALKR